MSALDYLSRLALALPLVLVLAVATLYAVKRGWLRTPTFTSEGNAVRLIQSLGVAPGMKLVVIEFEGRAILLAVSRAGVSTIAPSS